jgi:hypothetical protein
MNGIVLGFEIAIGMFAFVLALFLVIALPLWSLRIAVRFVEELTTQLDEFFSKRTLIRIRDGLIGLAFLIALALIALLFVRHH